VAQTRTAANDEAPFVLGDDPLGDPEAQTGASGTSGGGEGFRGSREEIGSYAVTFVGKGNADAPFTGGVPGMGYSDTNC
jgi:hypothetical protein